MFWRNLWLKVPLLPAAAAHATLSDAVLGYGSPAWRAAVWVVVAALVVPLLGEWIADEAGGARWRRFGFRVAAAGAGLHLGLDAGCLVLPWLEAPGWRFAIGGALVGAAVMGWLLHGYLAALADPEALPPAPWRPTGSGPLARLWSQAELVGGESILVTLIGLGFVVGAAVILIAQPEARREARGWFALGFFALVATIGAISGAQRRAAALGRPSPLAGLWPRWLRRATWVAAREGLLLVERRGARLYRWDDVVAVAGGELAHNPAVLILLAADAVPAWPLGEPAPRTVAREAKGRAVQRAWQGCDIALLGVHTEHGPGPLLAALALALERPETRASLPAALAEITRLRTE